MSVGRIPFSRTGGGQKTVGRPPLLRTVRDPGRDPVKVRGAEAIPEAWIGVSGLLGSNRDTRLGVSRYLFGGRGEGRSRVSRYLVRVRPGCHAPAPCKPPLDPFSAAKVVRNRPFILSTKRAGLDFAAFIASALCAPWTIANPR